MHIHVGNNKMRRTPTTLMRKVIPENNAKGENTNVQRYNREYQI